MHLAAPIGLITNVDTGYAITKSLVLDGTADKLTYTPASDTAGAKTWCVSFWYKPSVSGSTEILFGSVLFIRIALPIFDGGGSSSCERAGS